MGMKQSDCDGSWYPVSAEYESVSGGVSGKIAPKTTPNEVNEPMN